MNYCTKCGKEIPDGDSKICEECKNSLLTDLENEEISENIDKGNNDIKSDSTFKIKSDDKASKNKNGKKSKKIFACFLMIIIIAGCICSEIKMQFFTNLLTSNKVGVTIGNNNNNYGYAAKQGNWIYYMTLSEDATKICINKIKADGTNSQVLVEKDWEIYSLNVYKNYLYFVAYEPIVDENQYENNKIYKMSLDGSELTVINDNNFNDSATAIYVTNDRVFYIGENYKIYSMDLWGGDRKLVGNNDTGFIGVTDKYILFNDYPENPESETDFITYIMNLDGTDVRAVNGKRLYNPSIIEDKIYYVNGDNNEIHKVDITGENDEVIYNSPAYNMNVSKVYIYYLNFKNENADSEDEPVCIHRIKTDGTNHEIICEMVNYSSFLDIAGDWIYYTDYDDDKYYINLIKADGSDEITLYQYSMSGAPSETSQKAELPSEEITENSTNTVSDSKDANTTVNTANTVNSENTISNTTNTSVSKNDNTNVVN